MARPRRFAERGAGARNDVVRRSKIIVIGAGPAGGACALTLARSGRADVVVLDKSSYPRVKICGSGLSPHALQIIDALELRATIEPHHLHMRGVTARGPGGTQVHLRGAKGAWVVPRRELDHAILRAAQAAGAELHEDTKATALLRDGTGQVRGVETTRGTFEADLVVCANGSPSRFETDQTPRDGIRTIMGWWKGATLPMPDEGMFIWDERLEGYYAWLFPEPGGIVNVGLTVPERATQAARLKPLFHELLDQYFADILRGAEQVGKEMGHPATVTTRVGPISEARALWCGEAARLVSPGSVEGIGFAMESGMVAARQLAGLDPAVGLTRFQQGRYRASLSLRMLPKFWAGEAFVRLMRSPSARTLAERVANPQWLSERAAALVGESHR
jgi:menaquinone-9 beta-reductase